MPTRGREAVLSWGLEGVMEHQIVAFGREGGNPSEGRLAIRDSCPDMVGTGRSSLPVVPKPGRDSQTTLVVRGPESISGNLVNHNRTPTPVFFVSVASKGLS